MKSGGREKGQGQGLAVGLGVVQQTTMLHGVGPWQYTSQLVHWCLSCFTAVDLMACLRYGGAFADEASKQLCRISGCLPWSFLELVWGFRNKRHLGFRDSWSIRAAAATFLALQRCGCG